MSQTTTTTLLQESADLIARSIRLGVDSLLDMRDNPELRSLTDRLASLGRSVAGPAPVAGRSPCSCEIPPPCWYPRAAGDLTSFACPGGTAVLRVRVHNCGPTSRQVQIEAVGAAAVDPTELTLGPMEREVAAIKVDVPDDDGAAKEVLVWVRGCHAHYIRWHVVAAKRGSDRCCHELDVEDCPDYLHHWYDHFYCVHPCTSRRSADG